MYIQVIYYHCVLVTYLVPSPVKCRPKTASNIGLGRMVPNAILRVLSDQRLSLRSSSFLYPFYWGRGECSDKSQNGQSKESSTSDKGHRLIYWFINCHLKCYFFLTMSKVFGLLKNRHFMEHFKNFSCRSLCQRYTNFVFVPLSLGSFFRNLHDSLSFKAATWSFWCFLIVHFKWMGTSHMHLKTHFVGFVSVPVEDPRIFAPVSWSCYSHC